MGTSARFRGKVGRLVRGETRVEAGHGTEIGVRGVILARDSVESKVRKKNNRPRDHWPQRRSLSFPSQEKLLLHCPPERHPRATHVCRGTIARNGRTSPWARRAPTYPDSYFPHPLSLISRRSAGFGGQCFKMPQPSVPIGNREGDLT